MKIVDNALSEQVFGDFQNRVFNNPVQWYYTRTSISDDQCDTNTIYDNSFYHIAINDGQINSDLGVYCNIVLLSILDKMGIYVDRIDRARFGLLEPKIIGKYINKAHIDQPQNHMVGLLYLNDSDGETIVYNEKYDLQSNVGMADYILNKELTVMEKIECKSNRFVLFDGLHYHSSTCPTNVDRRIALNFNFTVKS